MNYSQPEEYRFSHDSVFLAREIFERVRSQIKPDWSVLDLCAGCGIVGLDFLHHCHKVGLSPANIDFLELQANVYTPHFTENVLRFGPTETDLRFRPGSFASPRENPGSYNLILSNPPYFPAGSGRLSPSEFKNRCRFFLDGSQDDLITYVQYALKPGGQAFLLMRNVPKTLEIVTEIRGTPLVQITRPLAP